MRFAPFDFKIFHNSDIFHYRTPRTTEKHIYEKVFQFTNWEKVVKILNVSFIWIFLYNKKQIPVLRKDIWKLTIKKSLWIGEQAEANTKGLIFKKKCKNTNHLWTTKNIKSNKPNLHVGIIQFDLCNMNVKENNQSILCLWNNFTPIFEKSDFDTNEYRHTFLIILWRGIWISIFFRILKDV